MKKIQLMLLLIILFGMNSCNYVTESSSPTKYLKVESTFNKNFWGDKINIKGTIINTAKSATYKDAVIRVKYLTKTNTVLHTSNYTIFEYFPPNSKVDFNLRIDNYTNTEGLEIVIINATSN